MSLRTRGEICEFNYGMGLPEGKRAPGRIDVYGSNGPVGNHSEAITDRPTIVIGRKGSVGEVNFSDTGCWPIDTTYYVARSCTAQHHKWLFYALRKLCLPRLNKATGVPGLNRSDGYEQKLLVPPINEQERIAAILDQADSLRRLRQRAIDRLNSLGQAIFYEMFGDPGKNHHAHKMGLLGDVIHSASDGPHVSPEYVDDGITFVSTRHVRPGKLVWEDLKYISKFEAEKQWKKCKPEYGDVLYTKGGTTGFAALVDVDIEFAFWVHTALLKPNMEVVDPVWLTYMLNSQYCYGQSQKFTRGIANHDLGLKRMINIKLFVPKLDDQKRFSVIVSGVARIEKSNQSPIFPGFAEQVEP